MKYLIENDLDAVSGWRRNRQDSFGKRFASRCANRLRHMMIHDCVQDSGCTLKVFRRECVRELDLYGELHRFIPALLKIRGWRIGEMAVNHRPRKTGQTKYNFTRIIKGSLDLLSVWFWGKYSNRPLHLLGGLGLLDLLLGGVSAICTIVNALSSGANAVGWLTITVVLFSMGMLFLVLGLLNESVMRIHYQKERPYRIRSTEYFMGETDEDPGHQP